MINRAIQIKKIFPFRLTNSIAHSKMAHYKLFSNRTRKHLTTNIIRKTSTDYRKIAKIKKLKKAIGIQSKKKLLKSVVKESYIAQEETYNIRQHENNVNEISSRNLSTHLTSLNQENSSSFLIDAEATHDIKEIFQTATNEQEICASLICFFFAAKINKSQFNLVLDFVKILTNIQLPTSFDACARILTNNCVQKLQIETQMFCSNCRLVSSYSKERNCKNYINELKCNQRLTFCHYTSIKVQLDQIFSKKLSIKELKDNGNFICDFNDGEIYKRFLNSSDGRYVYDLEGFTFTLSADGVKVCDKSDISVWPVFLTINEIEIQSRFCLDNVIIAALFVGQKPDFNIMLKPVILQLKELEYGEMIQQNNFSKKVLRFFLLFGVYDKQARGPILNMKLSTGYHGCLKCIQIGTRYQTSRKGGVQTYPFIFSDPSGPKRTKNSYQEDLLKCKLNLAKKRPIQDYDSRGVKGECILNSLKHHNSIESTGIDYMHSLIGGDVKFLMECWFLKSTKYKYSLKSHLKMINSRLSCIRPPQFIPCPPKSLGALAEWRCKDFLVFILYYALIVFKGIMSDIYYSHLKLLVISLEILLQKKISREHLEKAQDYLQEFVKNMIPLYGVLSMKSGMHELLHIVECTKELGHINSLNMFQFEELNRKVLSLINGKDLIGVEFLINFHLLQTLNSFLNKFKFSNNLLEEFLVKNSLIKTSNKKESNSSFDRLKITSKITLTDLLKYENLLRNLSLSLDKVPTITRCYYNKILFTVSSQNKRFCDSFIFDKELKKYGSILILIFTENKVYSIANEYIYLSNDCFSASKEIKPCGFLAAKSRKVFLSKIENIEKCLLYEINESLYYINTFKMYHLFI